MAEGVAVAIDILRGEPVKIIRDQFGNDTKLKESASPGDRLKALDILGKYGLWGRRWWRWGVKLLLCGLLDQL